MSRLTRSEIDTLIDDLIVAHPIYTPQLRALREQSISQEAVRDEALEEAANLQVHEANELETAAAYAKQGPSHWALKRLAKECMDRAVAIRALKREPSAAGPAVGQFAPYDAPDPNRPAPAAPVAEMVRRIRHVAHNIRAGFIELSSTEADICDEAAALLTKLGQGWIPVKNRSANYPAAKHLGEWDIIERERADGKLFSFTLPPLPGASDD